MVVIWDIDMARRKNAPAPNPRVNDWSLQQYYTVARRCIGAFASGTMAHQMLMDEDAVSFVAEHLMNAACRYDESKGRTFHSYMNQCAIWSICNWNKLLSKSCTHLSLNASYCNDARMELYETISSSTPTPEEIMIQEEGLNHISSIFDNAVLTDREKYCIETVYIDGEKPAHVARNLGVSRQAVHQYLTNGVAKIRTVLDGNQKQIPG